MVIAKIDICVVPINDTVITLEILTDISKLYVEVWISWIKKLYILFMTFVRLYLMKMDYLNLRFYIGPLGIAPIRFKYSIAYDEANTCIRILRKAVIIIIFF